MSLADVLTVAVRRHKPPLGLPRRDVFAAASPNNPMDAVSESTLSKLVARFRVPPGAALDRLDGLCHVRDPSLVKNPNMWDSGQGGGRVK